MRIQKKSDLTREILIKLLQEGICQISFTKVKDGTNRVIYCTLNSGFIPTKFEKAINKLMSANSVDDPDILPIWDVTEGKWKSFRITKLVYFLTHDELFDENKEGHNTSSNIVDRITENKQKLYEEFRKRVAELKEKALAAKNNINGVNNENEA